jgi:hypothetical protein
MSAKAIEKWIQEEEKKQSVNRNDERSERNSRWTYSIYDKSILYLVFQLV